MTTLIQNGLVYDGSGRAPVRGGVLLEDGVILQVGCPDDFPADRVIDAQGAVVTPGFVDTHRHCDLAALHGGSFGQLELSQGITSTLGGNCGLGACPSTDATRPQVEAFIAPCLGRGPAGLPLTTVADYWSALDWAAPPINVGLLAPTGAIKAAVRGYAGGSFSPAQMESAQSLLVQALEQGAHGISSGIMYVPECFSSRQEFVQLLGAAAPYRPTWAVHIRGEGDGLTASVQEVLDIARLTDLPLNISHFKAVGTQNWNRSIHQAIGLIDQARAGGQDVTVDSYPYLGGATTLLSLLPESVMRDGLDLALERLQTPAGRDALKTQLYRRHPGWDNMVLDIGWERILISSVSLPEHRELVGLSIAEAVRRFGFQDGVDVLCLLLLRERGNTGLTLMSMDQADVDTVAQLEYASVISDALYGDLDHPHPRLYGAFPKVIREYVLERRLLTMEDAVAKMSGRPAQRFGLVGRGLLRPGYAADINIFQPQRIQDNATFEHPARLASGMDWVLVNGVAAIQEGRFTDLRAGRALKPAWTEKSQPRSTGLPSQ